MFGFFVKYKTGDIDMIRELTDRKENCLILDVRDANEYKSGHIPKTENVPLNRLEKRIRSMARNKDFPIYVFCSSGSRSRKAAKMLTDMGYTDVTDLGGLNLWSFELVKV